MKKPVSDREKLAALLQQAKLDDVVESVRAMSDEDVAKENAADGYDVDADVERKRRIIERALAKKIVPLRRRRSAAWTAIAVAALVLLAIGYVLRRPTEPIAQHPVPPPTPTPTPTPTEREPDVPPRPSSTGLARAACAEPKSPFGGEIVRSGDAGREGDFSLVLHPAVCGDGGIIDEVQLAARASIDLQRYVGEPAVSVDGSLRRARAPLPGRELTLDVKAVRVE